MRGSFFYSFNKAVSFFVLVCFIVTSVFFGIPTSAFAQSTPAANQSPTQLLTLIPSGLGSVEQVHKAKTSPIFYIQDAHASLEAQENIAKMISHLVATQGVKTVYVEGYEGPLPLDVLFENVTDPELKQKVSYFLMDILRLNGAQYSYVNRKQDFDIVGIEDTRDYLENLRLYEASSVNRETIQKDLSRIQKNLGQLADKVFPKDFKDFLKLKNRFERGQLSLADYLFRAMKLDRKTQSAVRGEDKDPKYPHLELVAAHLHKRRLSAAEERQINERLAEIDHKIFFKELNQFENDFAGKQLVTKTAKQTYQYQKEIQLLGKLNMLQVSPDEYEKIGGFKAFDTVHIVHFLSRNLKKTLVLSSEWEKLIQDNIEFYEIAKKRDDNFKKILLKDRGESPTPVILVTGGFHTEPLLNSFKKNEISYTLIAPKFNGSDLKHEKLYDYLMTHEYYSFEKRFFGENVLSEALLQQTLVFLVRKTLAVGMALIDYIAGLFTIQKAVTLKELDRLGGELPGASVLGKGGVGKPDDTVKPAAITSAGRIRREPIRIFKQFSLRKTLNMLLLIGFLGLAPGSLNATEPVAKNKSLPRTVIIRSEDQEEVRVDVSDYRFAKKFTRRDLQDPGKREEFIANFLAWEGQFNQPGVGYDGKTGLTYDGHLINLNTGELSGAPRNWSAPSKESLHITLLAQAIAGNSRAQTFVSTRGAEEAKKIALDILERKMKSFEKFNRDYPGYAGFLPWFLVTEDGMKPTHDWQDKVPALDNGQFAWSLLLAADALKKAGHDDLAKRYQDYFNLLAKNVHMVFFDYKNNNLRGVTQILDNETRPVPINYRNPKKVYHLGNYEGDLLAIFWSLYGNPDPEDIKKVWEAKTKLLKRVDFQTKNGVVTIRQGWRMSSHEEWAFLVLPYLDNPLLGQIFRNLQVARTSHARENGRAGLYASAHDAVGSRVATLPYVDKTGIPGAGDSRAKITRTDFFVPYAAFPLFLVPEDNGYAGSAWLLNMLQAPRMQGHYGISESVLADGKGIGPILTYDGKVTLAQAMANQVAGLGAPDILRGVLKRDGKYDKFLRLVGGMYGEVFKGVDSLKGADLPLQLPSVAISQGMSDFKVPLRRILGINVMDGAWKGSMKIGEDEKELALTIPQQRGYAFTMVRPGIDLRKSHYLNLAVKTDRAGVFYLEFKNTNDRRMSKKKIAVQLPNTQGKWENLYVDFGSLLTDSNTKSFVVVISDPRLPFKVKQMNITDAPEKGFKELKYRRGRFGGSLGMVRDVYDIPESIVGVEGINLADVMEEALERTLSEVFGEEGRLPIQAVIVPYGSSGYLRDNEGNIEWDLVNDIDSEILFFEDLGIRRATEEILEKISSEGLAEALKVKGVRARVADGFVENTKKIIRERGGEFTKNITTEVMDEILSQRDFDYYFDDQMPFPGEFFGDSEALLTLRGYFEPISQDVNLYDRYESLWQRRVSEESRSYAKRIKALILLTQLRGDARRETDTAELVEILRDFLETGEVVRPMSELIDSYYVAAEELPNDFFEKRVPEYGEQVVQRIDRVIAEGRNLEGEIDGNFSEERAALENQNVLAEPQKSLSLGEEANKFLKKTNLDLAALGAGVALATSILIFILWTEKNLKDQAERGERIDRERHLKWEAVINNSDKKIESKIIAVQMLGESMYPQATQILISVVKNPEIEKEVRDAAAEELEDDPEAQDALAEYRKGSSLGEMRERVDKVLQASKDDQKVLLEELAKDIVDYDEDEELTLDQLRMIGGELGRLSISQMRIFLQEYMDYIAEFAFSGGRTIGASNYIPIELVAGLYRIGKTELTDDDVKLAEYIESIETKVMLVSMGQETAFTPEEKAELRMIGFLFPDGESLGLAPEQREILDREGQKILDYLGAWETYDIETQQTIPLSSLEEVASIAGASPTTVLIFGSENEEVPMMAANIIKKIQGNVPSLDVVASGGIAPQEDSGKFVDRYGKPQAEADRYREIMEREGVKNILVETQSTNSGQNVTGSRRVLEERGRQAGEVVIILQTPAIAKRAYLTFLKQYLKEGESFQDLGIKKLIQLAPRPPDLSELSESEAIEVMKYYQADLENIKNYPEKGFTVPVEIPDEITKANIEITKIFSQDASLGQLIIREPEGTNRRIAYKRYPIENVDFDLVFNRDWNNRVAIDWSNFFNAKFYDPEGNVQYNGFFFDGWTRQEGLARPFSDMVPADEILPAKQKDSDMRVAYGNLFLNDYFVVFKDGELFRRRDEPFKDREYPSVVLWSDGDITFENLEYDYVDGKWKAFVVMGDGVSDEVTEEIKLAFFGPPIVQNGEVTPMEELVSYFSDMGQVFEAPALPLKGGGQTFFGVGRAQLVEDVVANNITADSLAVRALKGPVTIQLPESDWAVEKYEEIGPDGKEVERSRGRMGDVDFDKVAEFISKQKLRNQTQQYVSVGDKADVKEPGDFYFDRGNKELTIWYLPSLYYHNMIGIIEDDDGTRELVSIVTQSVNPDKIAGYELDMLGDTFKRRFPNLKVLVGLAQGGDMILDYKGERRLSSTKRDSLNAALNIIDQGQSLGLGRGQESRKQLVETMGSLEDKPVVVVASLPELNELVRKGQNEDLYKLLFGGYVELVVTDVIDGAMLPKDLRQKDVRDVVHIVSGGLATARLDNIRIVREALKDKNKKIVHISDVAPHGTGMEAIMSVNSTLVAPAVAMASGEPDYQKAFKKDKSGFWVLTDLGRFLNGLLQEFLGAIQMARAA